jgi:hypothetical protein
MHLIDQDYVAAGPFVTDLGEGLRGRGLRRAAGWGMRTRACPQLSQMRIEAA